MIVECLDALTDDQAAEWTAFLSNAAHQHPRQDLRFAAAETGAGQTVLYAMGRRDGALRAVAVFTLRASTLLPGRTAMASAFSGPVCDDADDMAAFLQALAQHPRFAKIDAISVTPYWLDDEGRALASTLQAAGLTCAEAAPHRDTGMIDLTQSEDDLRISFSRSARRKVRLVEKSDIVIRRAETAAESDLFFERLNTLVIARHNLTPVPRAEYQAGYQHIYSDEGIGVIFNAFHDETFLGGLLLYRSGKTAHARRYVADPDAAKPIGNLRVAPMLWLTGILWSKAQGCTHYDVEGFLPVEDKDHPNFNVYEYKREFKPTHVTRISEHQLVLNATTHAANLLPGKAKNTLKKVAPGLRVLSPKRIKARFGK